MVDATVGIGMTDGSQWDGPGQVPQELLNTGAGILARRLPYVEFAKLIASLAIDLFEKPDPTGTAELLNGVNLMSRVDLKPSQEDTLIPKWQDAQGKAPSFAHVPLDEDTRIRVQLVDDDAPRANDPMGVCELSYQDLVEALQAQSVHHVNVANQTNQHIIFMGISVSPD